MFLSRCGGGMFLLEKIVFNKYFEILLFMGQIIPFILIQQCVCVCVNMYSCLKMYFNIYNKLFFRNLKQCSLSCITTKL